MSTAGLPPGVPLNNDDLGPQIIAATWTLTSISALFLFMRVYAKLWTQRGLWTDDYILIVAWLAVLAPAIMSTIAVNEGLGKHVYNVPAQNAPRLSVLINYTVTVLIIASSLSKTSFVMTVLRLVTGYMRWVAWFILVTTNIFFGVNVILLWATFNPNPAPTTAPPASVATSLISYGIFVTAYSAAMDFALVGMAWVVVSRLRMRTKRERIGVGLAMSMGVIAGVTSIIKATIFPTFSNGDISFTSASLHIWSLSEPAMTIIAASIPLLRIVFAHARQMNTQKSGTHFATGITGSGPSIGGSDRKRTGAVSVQFVKNSGDLHGMPYVNMGQFESSEENVMLENLQGVARVKTGDGPLHRAGNDLDEEEGIESMTPSSVLGLETVYETRLPRATLKPRPAL